MDKFQLLSYNLSDQDLQFIGKSVFSFPGLLKLVVKISNQGADSPTRLKGKAQMINQFLKRLLFLGGQAQIVLYLTPSLSGGIIFNQLDCFLLGQVTFYCINPDILQPGLKHQASIRGVTSFKFCHLWFAKFLKFCGCCL